jgi:uncharacterized RDD family membrane protein YckC
MAAKDDWFYARGNQQTGPVTAETLRRLIADGFIVAGDLVWSAGMTDWQPAGRVAELAEALRSAPPPPEEPPTGSPAGPAGPAQLQYGLGPSNYIVATGIQYATFGQRFVAALIDGILLRMVSGIVQSVLRMFFFAMPTRQMGALGAFSFALSICLTWLYYALMESSSQQATLGKMAMKLVVTDLDGHPITFGRATGRYFASLLSGAVCLIGYLTMLNDPRRQTWHDKLAGTLVLKPQ